MLLSDATVIVEAGEKSGSRHAGWEALRLGRPLFLFAELLSAIGPSWAREMEHYGAYRLELENLAVLFELAPVRTSGEASEIHF